MITVVADDVTGAAELAGIGWSHGLTAEVWLGEVFDAQPDLVAIDTDSRSCPEEEARRRVYATGCALRAVSPSLVFKKIDSVLRGHVVAEAQALMRALNLPRALLVPGNPGRQRFVRNGEFYVGGKPIHQTEFASDPEFPARSSNVLELLRIKKASELKVMRKTELPSEGSGFFMAEATTPDELLERAWAFPAGTLPVGSAEFFKCLLEKDGLQRIQTPVSQPLHRNRFFICGSASAASRKFIDAARRKGLLVLSSVDLGRASEKRSDLWESSEQVSNGMKTDGRVILAIDQPLRSAPGAADQLRTELVEVADQLLRCMNACDVFVEGGATAAAFAKKRGWNRLQVTGQLAMGVVMMRPQSQDSTLVIKPGSYAWPDHVF